MLPAAAQAMREATRKAATAIYNEAQGQPERSGMGTTLTAAFLTASDVNMCHVGDSRAYLYRGGPRPPAHRRSLLDPGADPRRPDLAGGRDGVPLPQHHHPLGRIRAHRGAGPVTLPVEAGDLLLLCSDGLSNYLNEKEMAEVLTARIHRGGRAGAGRPGQRTRRRRQHHLRDRSRRSGPRGGVGEARPGPASAVRRRLLSPAPAGTVGRRRQGAVVRAPGPCSLAGDVGHYRQGDAVRVLAGHRGTCVAEGDGRCESSGLTRRPSAKR